MRILLADDHALVRDGLILFLTETFKDVEVGEAADSQQTLAAAFEHPWDLIILDISMPGSVGLDVLKEIRERRPLIPVLVMSMHMESQFAVQAFRIGAAGYLTKINTYKELLKAVKTILAGDRYVSNTLAELLIAELGGSWKDQPHGWLSEREFEILRLIASGKTVKEMAAALCLSGNTVSTYRTRILVKMKMRTTAELMHYAISQGLVNTV